MMKLWKCPDCGADMKDWRTFDDKSALDKDKPFECTGFRCGKRFTEKEVELGENGED